MEIKVRESASSLFLSAISGQTIGRGSSDSRRE